MKEDEKNTVYARELSDSFEEVTQKMNRELSMMKSLELFFKEYHRLFEQMSKSLAIMTSYIRGQPEPTSSLRTALQIVCEELEQFEKETRGTWKEMQSKVFLPFEEYKEQYEKQVVVLIKKGQTIMNEIGDSRKKTEKSKEIYFNTSLQFESVQGTLKSLVESTREDSSALNSQIEKQTTKLLDLKLEADNSMQNYKKSLDTTNSLIGNGIAKYESVIDNLMKLDENRIEFIKSLIQKKVVCTQKMAKTYIDKATSIGSIATDIHGANDVKIFVNQHSKLVMNPLFVPIEFSHYQSLAPSIFEPERKKPFPLVEVSEDYFEHRPRDMQIIIEQTVISLTEGKSLSLEEKATVIEQLHKPMGKEIFAEILSNINRPTPIESGDAIRTFSELVNYLLTAIVLEKTPSNSILIVVLNISRNVFTSIEGRRTYLFSFLAKHGIWQEVDRWKAMIKTSIDEKIRELELNEQRKQNKKKQQEKSNEGMFGWTKKLGSLFHSNKTEDLKKDVEIKSRIINSAVVQVLQQYIFFLTFLKLEKCREIIHFFGRTYEISGEKIGEMELLL